MKDVSYEERVVIPLPNGEDLPATVSVRDEGKVGAWTHIKPDVGAVVPASGIAEETGAAHDYIYDLDARGVRTPSEMVHLFIRAWERAHE